MGGSGIRRDGYESSKAMEDAAPTVETLVSDYSLSISHRLLHLRNHHDAEKRARAFLRSLETQGRRTTAYKMPRHGWPALPGTTALIKDGRPRDGVTG